MVASLFVLMSIVALLTLSRHDLWNPVTVIYVSWILPVYVALQDLTGLYHVRPNGAAAAMVAISILLLYAFPATLLISQKRLLDNPYRPMTPQRVWIARLGAVLFVVLYFAENIAVTGFASPIAHGVDIHTLAVPLASIVTRNPAIFAIFLGLTYARNRDRLSLVLGVLVCAIPIFTRASRIDSIIALISMFLTIHFYRFPTRRSRTLFSLGGLTVGVVIAMAAITVARNRWGLTGTGELSVAKFIEYKGRPGPNEIFATYYAYFAMSVHNLFFLIEKFQQSGASHTFPVFSLKFLLQGIFKLNLLFGDYAQYTQQYTELRTWYVGVATVPTAFGEFYLDLGILAPLTPALILLVALYYYLKGEYLYYVVFIKGFFLIAFTNNLTDRNLLFDFALTAWFLSGEKASARTGPVA